MERAVEGDKNREVARIFTEFLTYCPRATILKYGRLAEKSTSSVMKLRDFRNIMGAAIVYLLGQDI